MHVLSGHISPRNKRVKGSISNHYVNILIDSGSTHNFIQERVSNQLGLFVTSSNPFRLYIDNGDFLNCDTKCAEVKLCLQGYKFCMDLFILPI